MKQQTIITLVDKTNLEQNDIVEVEGKLNKITNVNENVISLIELSSFEVFCYEVKYKLERVMNSLSYLLRLFRS